MNRFLFILVAMLLLAVGCRKNYASGEREASVDGCETLKVALQAYLDSCEAEIGVAVIVEGRDTVCVGDDVRYPLNSVMKLYQAMAVVDMMERCDVSLDSTIAVKCDELIPDTDENEVNPILADCHASF